MPPRDWVPELFKDSKFSIVPFDSNESCDTDLSFPSADVVFTADGSEVPSESIDIIRAAGEYAFDFEITKMKVRRRCIAIATKRGVSERIPVIVSAKLITETDGGLTFSINLNVNKKKVHKALLKLLRTPRKLTYKTLRHDCAKRNGRR